MSLQPLPARPGPAGRFGEPAQQQLGQADFPSGIQTAENVEPCGGPPLPAVGAFGHAQALHDAFMGRTVSDAEILDHVEHCTHLMELAHDRYEAQKRPEDHQAREDWMRARLAALDSLSPEWKAAREREIHAAMAEQGITWN